MTVAAGIDVGNSTTEVVLARVGAGDVEVLGVGRAPTRRTKGSPESLDGAVMVLRRLERQHGVRAGMAVAAPLRPVSTLTAGLPEPEVDTGRLMVLAPGSRTAGGGGFGVGRPCPLDALPTDAGEAVVVVVPAGTGFRRAVHLLAPLLGSGRLAAVLLADDEAVLVANRLGAEVPVVDEVDVDAVLATDLVAVEVREPGRPLRSLTDPLRLVTALGLADAERTDAARVAAQLHDSSNAVVCVVARPAATRSAGSSGWVGRADGSRVPFPEAHATVASGPVGFVRTYGLPPDDDPRQVDDLWTVDLASVADTVLTRRGGAHSRTIGLAALRSDAPYLDPSDALIDRLNIPVHLMGAETDATRAGGLSTPGASADAVVIDLGGGTVDAVSTSGTAVAAGGGELLTQSVSALTGATAAAAEWVKRGPAHRVDAPQLLLAEDGTREFLDRPAPPESIGALVVRGPAGLLAFHRVLAPGEWRALRLRLKVESVGGNVARALRTLGAEPATVIVVGGPAGDDEVLSAVSRALPPGCGVGRGDVGGTLGNRYAVAYGLLLAISR